MWFVLVCVVVIVVCGGGCCCCVWWWWLLCVVVVVVVCVVVVVVVSGGGCLCVVVVVVVVVVRTVCFTRVSGQSRARMQLIKLGQCQCTDPFGWTDQPAKNPTPFPSESRFQASPGAKTSPNSKSRKKIARHAGLTSPLLRRKGGAIFSIALELSAPGPEC